MYCPQNMVLTRRPSQFVRFVRWMKQKTREKIRSFWRTSSNRRVTNVLHRTEHGMTWG